MRIKDCVRRKICVGAGLSCASQMALITFTNDKPRFVKVMSTFVKVMSNEVWKKVLRKVFFWWRQNTDLQNPCASQGFLHDRNNPEIRLCFTLLTSARAYQSGRSGKIRFRLVASTYNWYQAEVRGRTFQDALRVEVQQLTAVIVPFEAVPSESHR